MTNWRVEPFTYVVLPDSNDDIDFDVSVGTTAERSEDLRIRTQEWRRKKRIEETTKNDRNSTENARCAEFQLSSSISERLFCTMTIRVFLVSWMFTCVLDCRLSSSAHETSSFRLCSYSEGTSSRCRCRQRDSTSERRTTQERYGTTSRASSKSKCPFRKARFSRETASLVTISMWIV